jgi:non-specific serine/threonine protein kinase
MLRRVAVFSGGVTVDSAEFVCVGGSVGRGDAVDLLTSLTDKNLLQAETHENATRFGMLETVRQYAFDRLRESGEEALQHTRHFEFFADLADALVAESIEEQRNVRLKRLDRELDNLRAALAWCDADAARAPGGLRLAGKLVWFWITRGYFSEGRGWIERYLAASPDGEGDEDRAKAFATAGAMAYHQDDYEPAVAYHQEAIALYRRIGQGYKATSLLGNLGALAVNRGDYQEARGLFDEALAGAREAGDRRSVALCLYNLGVLACATGDFEQARVVLEECVTVSREQGKWSAAGALQQFGWVRHAQGQHEEARSLLTESLDLHREFEDKLGVARTLYYLGMVSHDIGDIAGAKAQLHEALTLEQTVGDRILSASTLEALAGLSLEFATPLDAARLWGAAQRVREEIGAPQELVLKGRCERLIVAARKNWCDDAAFDAAWSEGRTMSLEAAVRLALEP